MVHDVTFAGVAIASVVAIVMREGWKKAFASGDAVAAVEATAVSVSATAAKG